MGANIAREVILASVRLVRRLISGRHRHVKLRCLRAADDMAQSVPS